jgi:HD-GYP domain-containing protein (c-di-GMP phosphodiesterase class II)
MKQCRVCKGFAITMPEEYQKQINWSGESLLKAINSLTKIAMMHSDNNELLLDAVRKFIGLIQKISNGDRQISIHSCDGLFYFQEKKVFLRPANVKLFNRMVRFFEDRSIKGLHIQVNLKGTGRKKIITFFRLLEQAIKHENPSDWLTAKMVKLNIDWVTLAETAPVLADVDSSGLDELAVRKANVRKSYANVMGALEETAHKLSANKSVGLRNSVRLVQKMVDLIQEDETLFLGISTIRIHDDYTYAHSLNVAILAMCLGNRIGLNHNLLERIGLCGLYHDLGKVAIPKALLNKKGPLSKKEYSKIKTHPMHSARMILKIKADGDRKSKILVPPFEHHMRYDNSGYPNFKTGPKISLFGRILAIADVYDAVTSTRVYRKEALSPDKALAMMAKQSGSHFDPILLKVFIQMLGRYPIGTAVKLKTGEIGVVINSASNGGTFSKKPIVQLLVKDAKERYQKGAIVDLSSKIRETNQNIHTIVETMHPSVIDVQPAEYIVG